MYATAILVLASSGGLAFAQSISFSGACPAPIDAHITGITPGGAFAILSADASGSDGEASGPCAGVPTGLQAASQSLVTTGSTSTGDADFLGLTLPTTFCGKSIVVVDATTCAVSPVATIPASTACDTWLATYDMTGTQLFIDALIDYTITVDEPYDNNLKMGPGDFTLRFEDDAGAPKIGGRVWIDHYALRQNFLTDTVGIAVKTDIMNTASDACGVAQGTLVDANTIVWDAPNEMAPYCQDGKVSCSGWLCGTSGSPATGDPIIYDNACSTFPLDTFALGVDYSTVDMDWVVLSVTATDTTSQTIQGTQMSMVLDDATPGCLCPAP